MVEVPSVTTEVLLWLWTLRFPQLLMWTLIEIPTAEVEDTEVPCATDVEVSSAGRSVLSKDQPGHTFSFTYCREFCFVISAIFCCFLQSPLKQVLFNVYIMNSESDLCHDLINFVSP